MMHNGQALEGIGLVLGRQVTADDVREDPGLGAITVAAFLNPEAAYAQLLLRLVTDENPET